MPQRWDNFTRVEIHLLSVYIFQAGEQLPLSDVQRQNKDNWNPGLAPEICTEASALHFTPAVVILFPMPSPSLSSMTAFAIALKIYSAGRSCDVGRCTASSAALVQWEGPNTLWRSTDMHLGEENFVDKLHSFFSLFNSNSYVLPLKHR